MKRIYKVRFIDDGDERTMEAALRGILRAKEDMRPKAKPLSAEAIINLQEPDINCFFDSSPRGRLRQIRRKARRIADRFHASRTQPVAKHYGPDPHPGTGTPQSVHAGGGATVSEEAVAQQAGEKATPYMGNVLGAVEEPKEEEAPREGAGPRMPSSSTALRAWTNPRTTIEVNDESACQEFLEDQKAGKWEGSSSEDTDRNPTNIAQIFANDLGDLIGEQSIEPDYDQMREDYREAVTAEQDEALTEVDAALNAFDGLSVEQIANTLGITEDRVRTADDDGDLSDWYNAYAIAQVMNSRYGENLTWRDLQDESPIAIEGQLLGMAERYTPEPDPSDYEAPGELHLDWAERGQMFLTARGEDGSIVGICETKDRDNAGAQYNVEQFANRLAEEGRDRAEANSPYIYLDLLASRESRQGYSSELMFEVLRRADRENKGLVGAAVDGASDYYNQFGAIWLDRYRQPGSGGPAFWPPSAVHEAVRMMDSIAEQVRRGELTLSMTERASEPLSFEDLRLEDEPAVMFGLAAPPGGDLVKLSADEAAATMLRDAPEERPGVRGILRRVYVQRVGTAASGHRGHRGRPGRRGGSLPRPGGPTEQGRGQTRRPKPPPVEGALPVGSRHVIDAIVRPGLTISEGMTVEACEELRQAIRADKWGSWHGDTDPRNPRWIVTSIYRHLTGIEPHDIPLAEELSSPSAPTEPTPEAISIAADTLRQRWAAVALEEAEETVAETVSLIAARAPSYQELPGVLGVGPEDFYDMGQSEISERLQVMAYTQVLADEYGFEATSQNVEDLRHVLEDQTDARVPIPGRAELEAEGLLSPPAAGPPPRIELPQSDVVTLVGRNKAGEIVSLARVVPHDADYYYQEARGVLERLGRDPEEAHAPFLYISLLASRESGQGYGTEMILEVLRRAGAARAGIVGQATERADPFYAGLGAIYLSASHRVGDGGYAMCPPGNVQESLRVTEMLRQSVSTGELTITSTLRRVRLPETLLTTEGFSSTIEGKEKPEEG